MEIEKLDDMTLRVHDVHDFQKLQCVRILLREMN